MVRLFAVLLCLSLLFMSWRTYFLTLSYNVDGKNKDSFAYISSDVTNIYSPTVKKKASELQTSYPSSILTRGWNDDQNMRYRYPINSGLSTASNSSLTSDNPSIKLSVISPSEGTELYRGQSITVYGQLRSAAPNDYWDGETVEIYYNLTEEQFKVDPDYYRGSDYYVTSVVTDSEGYFTATITTSTSTADFRSKMGNITIFTWFDGNPTLGRGSGSPGSSYVFIYGQLKFDVSYSVTNPGQPYSFTTRIRFDNGTLAPTSGTSYNLNITWLTDGLTDTAANYSFDASNVHTYSGTAPVTVQTVRYEAYYDSTQLSLNFFVAEGDTTYSKTLLHKVITAETSEQVVVDAYYVTGTGLTADPIEIPLDSYISVYANVTNSSGLVGAGYSVTIKFYHGTTNYNTTVVATNSSGAIEVIHYVDHTNINDITINNAFRITFTADPAEFGGADVTSDSLNSILAANVTTIGIAISDTAVFYTSGLSIDYLVYIQDEFGRNVSSAQFQVTFPGLALTTKATGSGGTVTLSSIIPNYDAIDQTPTKTITVTAQDSVGTTFKYYVLGAPVQDTDTFNMYYDLTLTLKGPYDADITDGETVSFFNNTYYSIFQTGDYYNLTVVDEWSRNPVGAPFSITLGGQTVSGTVSAVNNFIELNPDFDPTTGLNLSEPGTFQLTASAGEGNYIGSISHSITIYGPDNIAPTIISEVLSPNPFLTISHSPYFDVNFNISASDVGTGIRSVIIWYKVLESDNSTLKRDWASIILIDQGGGIWSGTISTTTDDSLCYIHYYIVVQDYAGYGLYENGTRQSVAQYNESFGWETFLYNSSNPKSYQVGDYEAPVQEAVPTEIESPDPTNPYLNITVYVNDSLIYTDISSVLIFINRTEEGGATEINWVNGAEMTNIPGTNAWFYQLDAEYNYHYTWYYVAYDNALPTPNSYKSQSWSYEAIDDTPPTMFSISVNPSSGLTWNSSLNFSLRVTDDKVGVGYVLLHLNYTYPNGSEFVSLQLNMTQVGTTSEYIANLSLSNYVLDVYGTYNLTYYFQAFDLLGNNASTNIVQLSVSNPAPPDQPPIGDPNNPSGGSSIGGIVGGAVGGIIALIIILFLWFNRHSIKNYAQQQTLRRRLRDYLREILEDIKRDGAEGRYKEGVVKTWQVIEGIGREFFDTPRFKHQTTLEYSRILARRGKIDFSIMNTLSEYFEKARYSTEAITETDFNAAVHALMKVISQLETGEMEIET